MKEFYRVPEVMEILNLGRTKTYELIRAGVIPSVDLDGNIRVPVRLLREKIDSIISTCKRDEPAASEAGDSATPRP